jgi:negative regulator of sigma E activity
VLEDHPQRPASPGAAAAAEAAVIPMTETVPTTVTMAVTMAVTAPVAAAVIAPPERGQTDETCNTNEESEHGCYLLPQQPAPPMQSLFARDCEEV